MEDFYTADEMEVAAANHGHEIGPGGIFLGWGKTRCEYYPTANGGFIRADLVPPALVTDDLWPKGSGRFLFEGEVTNLLSCQPA